MDYLTYTDRQSQILNGGIPIWKVSDCELNRILAKAQCAYDVNAITFVNDELKLRGQRIYAQRYSSADKDALADTGEADSSDLRHALTVARSTGDVITGLLIESELNRRGLPEYNINGYTPAQSALILSGSLGKAHINTLRGLFKAAVDLADEDVALWLDEERKVKKSIPDTLHKYTLREKHIAEGSVNISKMSNSELETFKLRARANKDEELIEITEAETQRRVLKNRELVLSKSEEAIINGKRTLQEASFAEIRDLVEKLKLHKQHPEIIETLEAEYEQRLVEWKKRNRRSETYTDSQLRIIIGETPLFRAKKSELEAIIKKAKALNDIEVVACFTKEIKSRENIKDDSPYSEIEQMIIADALSVHEAQDKTATFKPLTLNNLVSHLRDNEYYSEMEEYKRTKPYTKRELDILDGKIALDSLRKSDITKLAKKARIHGNNEMAERLETYVNKAPTYSARQQDVIKGNIPYEQISRTQIKNIMRKAKEAGDMRVINLMDVLMTEKIRDERIPKTSDQLAYIEKDEKWAMDVLESRIDPTYCTMKDLQNIRLYATTLNDPAYLKVAEYLIAERKDPSIVYKTHTWEDTIELLKEVTYMPINVPDTHLK
jgi:hypothetical protein